MSEKRTIGYGIAVVVIIILAILWQIFTKGGKLLNLLGVGGYSSPFNIALIIVLIIVMVYLASRIKKTS
jgi:hypothetical protein